MDQRDKIDSLFAASIASGFAKEKTATPFYEESAMIKLAAGTTIPNPTFEKIQRQVGELINGELNDLTTEPITYSVEFMVGEHQGLGSKLVKNGEGIIHIYPFNGNEDVEVGVPFLFANGELAPFDAIQMGGQRAPYSRENLGKVLNGIIEKGDPNSDVNSDGYVKLEKMRNPATTTGFLSDTLNVRTRGNVIPDIGGMFITAEEKRVGQLIEKLASMEPMNWESVEKAAELMAKQRRLAMIKTASDDGVQLKEAIESKMNQSNLSRTLPWRKVRHVPDRTWVKFPEYCDGEFKMTSAIVFQKMNTLIPERMKDLTDNEIIRFREYLADRSVIVTDDERVCMVDDDHDCLCLESKKPLFHLTTTRPDMVHSDEVITMRVNGKFVLPMVVKDKQTKAKKPFTNRVRMEFRDDNLNDISIKGKYISNETRTLSEPGGITSTDRQRLVNGNQEYSVTYFEVMPIGFKNQFEHNGVGLLGGFGLTSSSYYFRNRIYLIDMEEPFFGKIDATKCAGFIAKKFACDTKEILSLMGIDSDKDKVYAMSTAYPLVRLHLGIGKTFASLDEVDAKLYGKSSLTDDEKFEALYKQASSNDKISIQRTGKDKYTVRLSFANKTNKMYQQQEEKLVGLSEDAVLGALIALKFSKETASDLMVKANQQKGVETALPGGSDPSRIFHDNKSIPRRAVAKYKQTDIADRTGRSIKTALSYGVANAKNVKVANEVMGRMEIDAAMTKLASLHQELVALSGVFEKRAMEEENVHMRKCAKAAALGAYFLGDAEKVLANPEDYPHFDKLAQEVAESKDFLEDCIGGLLSEKVACYLNEDNHRLPVSYYSAAIDDFDKVYQIAKGVTKK